MISVVIPAYNAEKHIERCLDSICAQTYQDFEVIVVDDGSTDRTPDIVEAWTDSRVRLVQQPNAGVSAARNKGIEEARGDWVAFLDSDDRWKRKFLETVVRASAEFPDVVALFTNFENSVNGRAWIPLTSGRARVLNDYFKFVLEHKQGMWASCSMIRRDVLRAIGAFPVGVSHGEDLDTWARLAWTGSIAYVPDVLAVYHTETEGSAMKVPLHRRLRYPEVLKTYRQWKGHGKIPEHLLRTSKTYAQRYLYSYVGQLLVTGAKKEARSTLIKECMITFSPLRYLGYLLGGFVPTSIYNYLRTVRHRFG